MVAGKDHAAQIWPFCQKGVVIRRRLLRIGDHLVENARPVAVVALALKAVVVDQAVDIEPGATDDHRQMAARENVVDRLLGAFLERQRIKRLVRIKDIEHVMRHALHLLRRDLGGADVHAAVDLHGIAGNDLCVEGFRESDGERCLSDSRRPNDDNEWLFFSAHANDPLLKNR